MNPIEHDSVPPNGVSPNDVPPSDMTSNPLSSPSPSRPSVWQIVAIVLTLLVPGLLTASGPNWRSAADQQAANRDSRYGLGQKALDDNRFDDAAKLFRAVADDGGPNADGARYWQAWAEWKAGNGGAARRSLERLEKDHDDSPWLDDARSLRAEIRAGRRDRNDHGDRNENDDAESSDDALRLYALNSMMNSDSPRAVDAVVRLLDRTEDAKLHERALFVLSQSESEKAAAVLTEIARGQKLPGLQMHAIRYLGMSDHETNIGLLESIYAQATQPEVKAAVLQAYLVADAEPQLVAIAKGETDEKLRHEAIRRLGMIDANASLEAIYRESGDKATKTTVLQALGLSDNASLLLQVARSESDPDLRASAIRGLGTMDAGAELRALYEEATDLEEKKSIMSSLFIADEVGALLEIARRATSPAEREAAVHWLSLSDDDEALAYLLEILEGS